MRYILRIVRGSKVLRVKESIRVDTDGVNPLSCRFNWAGGVKFKKLE